MTEKQKNADLVVQKCLDIVRGSDISAKSLDNTSYFHIYHKNNIVFSISKLNYPKGCQYHLNVNGHCFVFFGENSLAELYNLCKAVYYKHFKSQATNKTLNILNNLVRC